MKSFASWKIRAAIAVCAFVFGALRFSFHRQLFPSTNSYEYQERVGAYALMSPKASKPTEAILTSSPEVCRVAEAIRTACHGPVEGFWRVRVKALVDLAHLGPKAVPAIKELLEQPDPGIRALACEALGILGDVSASEALERSVVFDPDSQVRLYAARSLGQLGTIRPTPEILRACAEDDVYDVRRHIKMSLYERPEKERGEILKALAAFDPVRIGSAAVEGPAPDFQLRDLDGKMHRISDYRGKHPLILVFLLGDSCHYCPDQIVRLGRHKAQIEELGARLLFIEGHESFRVEKTIALAEPTNHEGFPVLADPSLTVSAAYGVAMRMRPHIEWSSDPATFVIDRSGIIRLAHREQADRRMDPEVLIQMIRLMNRLDAVSARPADAPQPAINGL